MLRSIQKLKSTHLIFFLTTLHNRRFFCCCFFAKNAHKSNKHTYRIKLNPCFVNCKWYSMCFFKYRYKTTKCRFTCISIKSSGDIPTFSTIKRPARASKGTRFSEG